MPTRLTTAPASRRPAPTSIAIWKASPDASVAAVAMAWSVPGAGRLSGLTSERSVGEPEHAGGHQDRANHHEPARAVAARELADPGGENGQQDAARQAAEAGGGRVITERSLLEESQVVEDDVERAVDQQRRDVDHGEVAGLEERRGEGGGL